MFMELYVFFNLVRILSYNLALHILILYFHFSVLPTVGSYNLMLSVICFLSDPRNSPSGVFL
jgi:hypothetical protein